MNGADAAKRAAAVLDRAELIAVEQPDAAQALTWIADSWRGLAETLDEHPRLGATPDQ